MIGRGRFYGCCRGKFLPQVVGHEKGEKLSLAEVFWSSNLDISPHYTWTRLSRFGGCLQGHRKTIPCERHFLIFFLTNLGMRSTVFTGAAGKFSPSSGRSRESGKNKPPEKYFRSPSLRKELAGPFLWVLPKRILKSLASGRSWEGEKNKDQGKFSLVASKLMP